MMALEIKELAHLWSKVTMEIWDIHHCLLGTSNGKLSNSLHAQERWDKPRVTLQSHWSETQIGSRLHPTPPTLSLLTLRVPKPSCGVQISPDVGSSRLSPGVFPLPAIRFLLLGDLTQYQGFKYHPYADNSQIYLSTLDLFPELQTHISNCLLDIALECLIDISNVTCQKWSTWSAPLDSCCLSFLYCWLPGAWLTAQSLTWLLSHPTPKTLANSAASTFSIYNVWLISHTSADLHPKPHHLSGDLL